MPTFQINKDLNKTYPSAGLHARLTLRRLMDERFSPVVFHTYRVPREQAIILLAPHYRSASKMSNAMLEVKLNYLAGKIMNMNKIACFSHFTVVDPSAEDARHDVPGNLCTAMDETSISGSRYDYIATQEEWRNLFRGTY